MAFENIKMTNPFFAKEGAGHRPVESIRDERLYLKWERSKATYFHMSPVVAMYIFSNNMVKGDGKQPTIGVENPGTQKAVCVTME